MILAEKIEEVMAGRAENRSDAFADGRNRTSHSGSRRRLLFQLRQTQATEADIIHANCKLVRLLAGLIKRAPFAKGDYLGK